MQDPPGIEAVVVRAGRPAAAGPVRPGIYGEPPDTYTEEPLTPGIVQTEELRSPRREAEENRRHGNNHGKGRMPNLFRQRYRFDAHLTHKSSSSAGQQQWRILLQ